MLYALLTTLYAVLTTLYALCCTRRSTLESNIGVLAIQLGLLDDAAVLAQY